MSRYKVDKQWRNYRLGSDNHYERFSQKDDSVQIRPPNANSMSNSGQLQGNRGPIKRLPKSRIKSASKRYSSSAITQKFSNNIKFNKSSILSDETINDLSMLNETYDLSDFQSDINMKRNLDIAPKGKFTLDTGGVRRIATKFSRLISKISEDMTGEPEPGDEFWDIERLLYRQLSNESILNCKMSRQKEVIMMILDSSPSCSKEAKFYSSLASVASIHNDIELYNAPNARLVEIYNRKAKKFVPFLTPQDIANRVHEWSLFRNRVIIFFGDSDGVEVVSNAAEYNKIYWFHKEPKRCIDDYVSEHRNVTIFESITSTQSFINAMKTIR